jgi:hypothetical protein
MGQNLAVQIVSPGGGSQIGGIHSALNITSASVVKSSSGTLFSIIIQNAGSSGNLIINDSATIGGAATSNQILSFTAAQLASLIQKCFPVALDFPCLNGITVSAVPAGSPVFAIAYT